MKTISVDIANKHVGIMDLRTKSGVFKHLWSCSTLMKHLIIISHESCLVGILKN